MISPCVVIGTLALIGWRHATAADPSECTAQMSVTPTNSSQRWRIACQVWFDTGSGSAGLQASVPNKGPETFLTVKFGGGDIWSVTSTFNLTTLGWSSFVDEGNDTDRFDFGITVRASCRNEIEYQCYCGSNSNASEIHALNSTEPFKVEGLLKKVHVWLGATTPRRKLWHEGVPAGTFVGASCFAIEDLGSDADIHWVIHRNGIKEHVDATDPRVFRRRKEEIHRAEDPADLRSYVTSHCDLRRHTSTLNFKVSRTQGPVQLECTVRTVKDTDYGKSYQVEASVSTDPIQVIMAVKDEWTVVTLDTRHGILRCESLANPAPTYIWAWGAEPGKVLYSSVGGGPSYLHLSTVPFKVNFDQGDTFLCNASNTISDKLYTASVSFSQNNMLDRMEVASVLEESEDSKDELAATVLSTSLTVGAALVLAALTWLLIAEQVTLRRQKQ